MNEKKLTSLLNHLNCSHRDIEIEASEIVTTDGVSKAAALPDDCNEDRVGPLCAGVFCFARGVAKAFGMGEVEQIILTAGKSSALINLTDEQTLLAMKIKSHNDIERLSQAGKCVTEEIGHAMA
ncbi:roadblock/LC7 domain-containing protein [Methylomarinum sp. Ch1-1]|uniref:Roadblock/LC7 domain-containing protein n=1 Tax=Methylomarinum roseum TaxID=3067653 RepID=A0AAU7NZK5_9GAMM|nr:roadblock/LC7 domain-containing protein [Methylomarinum sp. Ch1-1]MDP4521870.1 roadblock/LC7 domain-containing protein [Methylomarinum sp. Ch1-1]